MRIGTQSLTLSRCGRLLDGQIVAFAAHFGERRQEIERIIRFLITGASGVVVDFTLLYLLQATLLVPSEPDREAKILAATSLSFSVAVLNNYILNRMWTFRDSQSGSFRQQLGPFVLISVACGVVRTVFVLGTFAWFGHWVTPLYVSTMESLYPAFSASSDVAARIGTTAAQLVGLVIVTALNYLGNRFWTFRSHTPDRVMTRQPR